MRIHEVAEAHAWEARLRGRWGLALVGPIKQYGDSGALQTPSLRGWQRLSLFPLPQFSAAAAAYTMARHRNVRGYNYDEGRKLLSPGGRLFRRPFPSRGGPATMLPGLPERRRSASATSLACRGRREAGRFLCGQSGGEMWLCRCYFEKARLAPSVFSVHFWVWIFYISFSQVCHHHKRYHTTKPPKAFCLDPGIFILTKAFVYTMKAAKNQSAWTNLKLPSVPLGWLMVAAKQPCNLTPTLFGHCPDCFSIITFISQHILAYN